MSRSEKPLSQVIRERRSTPSFTPEPIPGADLKQILNAAMHAPSGYNTQPWRFVVVQEAALRKKLRAAAMNQKRVEEAPVIIVACGDPSGLGGETLNEMLALAAEHGFGDERQHELVRQNFPRFLETVETAVWLNRQVAIAVTHMMLMAETLGYDTAIMEGFHEDDVKRLLDVPDAVRVVALLCIGKLSGPDKPFGGRFAMNKLVFSERWGKKLEIRDQRSEIKKSE